MANRSTGYEQALAAIAAGTATAAAHWALLGAESDRDGYALKPSPWEGPGEYQCVRYADGRSVYVRLLDHKSLPIAKRAKVAA